NKVYDGTTNAVVNGTLNGIVSGDSVTSSNTSANFTDKNVGNSKTVNIDGIFLEGIHSGNYSISGSATATANITPKAITANYTAENKVYDGTTNAVVNGTLNGIVSGDSVTFSNTSANFTDKNAGENKTVNIAGISISGTDSSNYSISNTSSTTADIIKKELTANYTADNKIYDGTTSAVVSGTLDGVLSGETVTFSNTTANFADKNAGDGKIVNVAGISISGTDSSNYSISSDTTTTADITKKELTANYTADNKVYDGTTDAVVNGTLNGIISGDSVTLSKNASFVDKNVGTSISINGLSLDGIDSGNYFISSSNSDTADITPRVLKLEASKEYDGTTDLTGFVKFVNLAGDETLNYSGAKANSKDSGNNNYISSITLADGKNGGLVSNYELPSLLAYSVNNSVIIEEKPSLSDVITPIANQTVLTNKDIEALLKSGVDIQTIFQQLNTNELALIPGVVMRVLDGGINLPFGSKQQLSLDNDNNQNNDDKEKKLI
uniref:YDG domain-containing protein n=1 Tax=Halarcobacter sp. TaxID=2321133 RepID=UPI003A92B99E